MSWKDFVDVSGAILKSPVELQKGIEPWTKDSQVSSKRMAWAVILNSRSVHTFRFGCNLYINHHTLLNGYSIAQLWLWFLFLLCDVWPNTYMLFPKPVLNLAEGVGIVLFGSDCFSDPIKTLCSRCFTLPIAITVLPEVPCP